MPTYIALLRWTQKGIENVKESPSRLDQAKEALRAVGGEFKDFYLTMGSYDMVCVCEAPDDAAIAKFVLGISTKGGCKDREPSCLFRGGIPRHHRLIALISSEQTRVALREPGSRVHLRVPQPLHRRRPQLVRDGRLVKTPLVTGSGVRADLVHEWVLPAVTVGLAMIVIQRSVE